MRAFFIIPTTALCLRPFSTLPKQQKWAKSLAGEVQEQSNEWIRRSDMQSSLMIWKTSVLMRQLRPSQKSRNTCRKQTLASSIWTRETHSLSLQKTVATPLSTREAASVFKVCKIRSKIPSRLPRPWIKSMSWTRRLWSTNARSFLLSISWTSKSLRKWARCCNRVRSNNRKSQRQWWSQPTISSQRWPRSRQAQAGR